MTALSKKKMSHPHVIDVFANVKGRDQPIMRLEKAMDLVNQLDNEVFTNDQYVFFDPFCKSGEILLASLLISLQHKSKQKLTDLSTNVVYREMFKSDRYFAMAPDERHYRLSLRTFYGNEKSHNPNFIQNIKNGNYLSEIDGKLNKDKFNKELQVMIDYIKEKSKGKKIIAVGNPPYQENYSGNVVGANPIYNIFIECLINCENIEEFLLVIPARWYSGGRGLDSFRKKMFSSKKIVLIKDFENGKDIFPTVEIPGGISFINYKKNYSGKTLFESCNKKIKIDLTNKNIIVREVEAYQIIDKILSRQRYFIKDVAWPWNPFGLDTNYFTIKKENKLKINNNSLNCFCRGREIKKIPKEHILKNRNHINEFQVICPKAYGAKRLPPKDFFFVINKDEVCTATYNVIHTFKIKKEADNFCKTIKTNFVRYLLGLVKITQDIFAKTWIYVPLMPVNKSWTDEELFKYFNLTKAEQKYIIEQVKKWTV